VQNRCMVVQRIVPAGATIAELKRKAADLEEKAKQAPEPEATRLKEEALLCREWIAALRSGLWHS
jgi:hypothetical protein